MTYGVNPYSQQNRMQPLPGVSYPGLFSNAQPYPGAVDWMSAPPLIPAMGSYRQNNPVMPLSNSYNVTTAMPSQLKTTNAFEQVQLGQPMQAAPTLGMDPLSALTAVQTTISQSITQFQQAIGVLLSQKSAATAVPASAPANTTASTQVQTVSAPTTTVTTTPVKKTETSSETKPKTVKAEEPADDTAGKTQYKSKASAYYPDNSAMEGGFNDMRGKPLKTLQDFLEGKADYVSVAMDTTNKGGKFPYGTELRIPELEKKYGKKIKFKVVDTGGAFYNKGTSRIDICVRNEKASFDAAVNGNLTLIPV